LREFGLDHDQALVGDARIDLHALRIAGFFVALDALDGIAYRPLQPLAA